MGDVNDLGNGALQIGLDVQGVLGTAEYFQRSIQAVADEPDDHWNFKFRRLLQRQHNQPGQLSQVGDAGKEVHDDHFDPGALADPAQGLHQPCWVAPELTSSYIAKIERATPSLYEFVNELHAESCASGDETHIAFRVQADEVKAAVHLADHIGVGV